MSRKHRNRCSGRLRGKVGLLRKYQKSNTRVATKITVANVSTSTSQSRHSAVDETQCSKNCAGCLWFLRASSYCFNWGKKIHQSDVANDVITRRPLRTVDAAITSLEALPLLETLAWSRGLGLRVLWNISCRNTPTMPRDIAEWTRHHIRRNRFSRKLRGPYCVTSKGVTPRNFAISLSKHILESLAIHGMITCRLDRSIQRIKRIRKSGKGKLLLRRKTRVRINELIFPKIKTITINFSPYPWAKLIRIKTYKEAYEWFKRLTSDWKPLTPNMLCEQKENVTIVFPCINPFEPIRLGDEENWQMDPEIHELLTLADLNYHIAVTSTRNAIRLWKESGSLSRGKKQNSGKEQFLN